MKGLDKSMTSIALKRQQKVMDRDCVGKNYK